MEKPSELPKSKRKELGISCMFNTEVGAILAVLRRPTDSSSSTPDDIDPSLLHSLKSLRTLAFTRPHQHEWRTEDPSIYLTPFLDIIQSEVPAAATSVALSAVLKILKLEVFDIRTAGAREAMSSIVDAVTACRLELTDPFFEGTVMMKILVAFLDIMNHSASVLLTDHCVCTIVNSCFQIVQQSVGRLDLLPRNARFIMHELIRILFSRMPEFEGDGDKESSGSDNEESGYGVQSALDIFHFLCTMLNAPDYTDSDGSMSPHQQQQLLAENEEFQLFALVMINTAIELSGDSIARHPSFLRMVQDDLFHHLIHYGTCSSPLVLSMICSAVFNNYHFLRRYLRLQLESFFMFVLLRISAAQVVPLQLQEVSLEGIINFCRQPTFIIEAYVNYDCDPVCKNVFEEIGRLLCKHSFPVSSNITPLKVQAFEGLMTIVHNIAENIDREDDSTPSGPYPVQVSEFKPFWEDRTKDGSLIGDVESLRLVRAQKRKLRIAAYHFNRDEKKGLDYLKFAKLAPDPPEPKPFALFFRYTPGLDKNKLGDYLGDPDEFNLRVLREFTESFEFSGMVLDTALRTYLETFRLPGESQKIQRILEAFSDRFYEQQTEDLFESKDVVFILCYSLIMLNTDQHNPQVKKKMTEEEFIRNNRAINGGKDLPKEYLYELFNSISNNAITIFGQSGQTIEMSASRWIELMNRSRTGKPYALCSFDRRLGRDMFSCIAGPAVASLCAFFELTDEEDLLHECVEGLFSIARIAQYGLEETLDEILASFCKFTTLLNPYATADETLFSFSHDLKPKIATLAVFTLANHFGGSIRGGWKNIVECLLKLKRLKLLPQSVVEFDSTSPKTPDSIPASFLEEKYGKRRGSGMTSRFSHFFSMDTIEESLSLGMSEFEQNLKIIKHCRIGSVFSATSSLPEDALINLGRSLIFTAAGKGQKFSTSVEEEETVGFCWDLIIAITMANIQRFLFFWPALHDHLLAIAQYPMFSPVPFAEKAIIGLFKVCLRLLGTYQPEKHSEELIFKSINLMWKLDKEILETCSDLITSSVNKILTEFPANLKSQLGWKSVLHLLSITGRHPETYELGVETLIMLISDGNHISWTNYAYCVDAAFSFVALRNSPLDKNIKILDLLANTVTKLVQWYRNQCAEHLGSNNFSSASNTSTSSVEDNTAKVLGYSVNLFIKLGEALRKTSLARREEIRNHAVVALQKSYVLAEELDLTPGNVMNCFNLVIFAMVDDLHEKMVEYSRRDNAERETRSMEVTLRMAMELLTEVFMRFMRLISSSPGFRTFWLGVLRRMDTYMKADLGEYGKSKLRALVPDLLRKIIMEMKENEILMKKDGDDLWEITYIQIQWIAPSIKDELFPEEIL